MKLKTLLFIIWAIFWFGWLIIVILSWYPGYYWLNKYQLYMIILSFAPLIPQWILSDEMLDTKIFSKNEETK